MKNANGSGFFCVIAQGVLDFPPSVPACAACVCHTAYLVANRTTVNPTTHLLVFGGVALLD